MPPKRKAGEPVYYTKNKAQKTKVYGNPTGKKQYKKLDADAMVSATIKAEIAKGVTRQMSKTIETQYSYSLISMLTSSGTAVPPGLSDTGTGFKLTGLNQSYNPSGVVNQPGNNFSYQATTMLVFNLSALSQVRSATTAATSGFRVGNKCYVNGIDINVWGEIKNPNADGVTYHAMIVRSKDGASAKFALQPRIVTSASMKLFKAMTDGPLASVNTGDGVDNPVEEKLSLMRRNYDSWSFPSSAMASKTLKICEATNADYKQSLDMRMYFKVDSTWDFTTAVPGDSVLKGGDYFFVLWREGPTDPASVSNIYTHFALSFKDA
jgi:hypothetical protein